MSSNISALSKSKLTLALLAASAVSGSAYAQTVLEEVVVTAQKREQSLQDVPISVAAIAGDALQDAGVENIEDIVAYVPNLHLTESGFGTQFRLRGVGSGNNQGFEQSVGQYIDGIYYGRSQLFRAPFLDLERVEVLRGPQSVLFGKNSIAGAISLTTAKPTEKLEGYVRGSYEPELEASEIEAVLSGPIAEGFSGRLALRQYDEAGYYDDTFTGEKAADRDETSARLTLAWTDNEAWDVTLKAEHNTFDVLGRNNEIVQDDPSPAPLSFIAGVEDPATAAFLNQFPSTYSNIGSVLFGQPGFDDALNFKRQGSSQETSENELTNITLAVKYSLSFADLDLVTGSVGYEFNEFCNCDFVPGEVFTVEFGEDYDQFSQEIRLTSTNSDEVEWIAGVFYQDYDLDFNEQFTIIDNGILDTALSNAANAAAGTTGTPFEVDMGNTGTLRSFNQTSETLSAFGQVTWYLSESFSFTVGGRYTQEEKTGTRSLVATDFDTGEAFANVSSPLNCFAETTTNPLETISAPCLILTSLNADTTQVSRTGAPHDLSADRTENVFTPLVNVTWNVNDDVMLYATYTTGFKAGGYDSRSNSVLFFEYEEEEVDSFELGSKLTYGGGRGELNLALYMSEYTDLQVSQFDGAVGFNVTNAAQSDIFGIELDGRFAATQELTLNYSLALNDFEYGDFQTGGCAQGETPDGIDTSGDGTIDTCDYTGRTGTFAPDLTAAVGARYVTSISDTVDFSSMLNIQYMDSHFVHENQDPNYEIDAYQTVDLRLGVGSENWEVALLGKNLTDEEIITFASNVPLSDSLFGTRTYYGFVSQPRTVRLEGTYRF